MKKMNENTNQFKELLTSPGPRVTHTILSNSLSDDFEEARTEWELVDHIPSDSKDFVENCELCNHKNYKVNWLIRNSNTNAMIKVGSDCITRFIQFAGTSSQVDSNMYFQNRQYEIRIEETLKLLYKEVIRTSLPLARQTNKFKKTLLELLEFQGKKHLIDNLEGQKVILENILKIPNLTIKDYNNFNDLLNGSLPVQRETKRYREYKYKEGSTMNKKGTKVVGNTLTRSETYRNPEKKYQ